MNNPTYLRLLEASWRRPLTAEEKECLHRLVAQSPETRAQWEADAALTRVLRGLPEPVLASNFTARVMQAARRQAAHPSLARVAGWKDGLRSLWPRLAWGTVALALGFLTLQAYGYRTRAKLARDLASLPIMAKVPSPEILQDFDAIQQFSQASAAPSGAQAISDEALLEALQ